jgi:ketosteroid isomerase-like protein
VAVVSGQREKPATLESLVAAERAFARASVENGVRSAFIEFFANDGIGFDPHPTKMKEAYLNIPAPATRRPVVLDWQPAYADVSRAGDLGYTTGPFTFTDKSPEKRPTRYGFYFSIWKTQPDGSWKVVLDCGIHTPDHSGQHFPFRAASHAYLKKSVSSSNLEAGRSSLITVDRQFQEATNRRGAMAYIDYLAADSRLHRDGLMPLIGRNAIRSFLSKMKAALTWEPMQADIAQSGDLGYTLGRYELKPSSASTALQEERGYYVRVWKRDNLGKWKLVLDTLSPIPAEKK